jgi:hypothetical protein
VKKMLHGRKYAYSISLEAQTVKRHAAQEWNKQP